RRTRRDLIRAVPSLCYEMLGGGGIRDSFFRVEDELFRRKSLVGLRLGRFVSQPLTHPPPSLAGLFFEKGRRGVESAKGLQVRQGWRTRSMTQDLVLTSLASEKAQVRQLRHASPHRADFPLDLPNGHFVAKPSGGYPPDPPPMPFRSKA